MKDIVRPALVLLALFTLICGVAYPALVTVVARTAFARQATGSIVTVDGRAVGSTLIGQTFTAPGYCWGRPSAVGYDGTTSAGSNLGPSNPALAAAVSERIAALRAADPDNHAPIPVDLITASASGLDPHVSPAAARYQAGRIARARGVAAAAVRAVIDRHVEGRTLGILGEPRVGVVALNLALDRELPAAAPRR